MEEPLRWVAAAALALLAGCVDGSSGQLQASIKLCNAEYPSPPFPYMNKVSCINAASVQYGPKTESENTLRAFRAMVATDVDSGRITAARGDYAIAAGEREIHAQDASARQTKQASMMSNLAAAAIIIDASKPLPPQRMGPAITTCTPAGNSFSCWSN